MIEHDTHGRIVLVSSLLGLTGLLGYTSYSPVKHALRGLADSLQSEFHLYPKIDISCYFPATMKTPGYDEEEKSKPELVKKIEKGDPVADAKVCAKGLLRGIDRGDYFITTDFNSALFKNLSRGVSPMSDIPLDLMYGFIAAVSVTETYETSCSRFACITLLTIIAFISPCSRLHFPFGSSSRTGLLRVQGRSTQRSL